ncbi:hypothetical protein Ccrd_016141 [Cynara cardunculus var. scolymus]|uniref:Uncharacterized protein n=1 Tax=Cynara cardunculus var. scolymus TaxID=59895 RepID=A0A103YAI9_CYNCS|nr:hypothetical protein Ccrd_016141 [Cynara cardunculus var. scolymus]
MDSCSQDGHSSSPYDDLMLHSHSSKKIVFPRQALIAPHALIDFPPKTLAIHASNMARVPIEVKSISPKSLSASVSDIGSVVSMIDNIAGSAPGNGSRTAVGEDLVAMTKLHLQARTSGIPDGTRKIKRFTSAIPLNGVSSVNSVNDNFKHFNFVEASVYM